MNHQKLVWEELSLRGYMSYEEVIAVACKEKPHKESEIERRLRPSESPCVRPVMGTKEGGGSFIRGYEWICSAPYKIETKADKQRARIAAEEKRILANPALLQ